MRKLLLIASLLVCVTLCFGSTGLVYDEGGFGVRLVLKPELSAQMAFGGGEEGQWQRNHAGEPRPWWQQATVPVLLDGDWEEGTPTWVNLYLWSLALLIFVLWPLFGLAVAWSLGRSIWRNSRSRKSL